MSIMVLLFSLFTGIGYHPVLTLHNPQPVMHLGPIGVRPVAPHIVVYGRY